jgi:hypothetical protein
MNQQISVEGSCHKQAVRAEYAIAGLDPDGAHINVLHTHVS